MADIWDRVLNYSLKRNVFAIIDFISYHYITDRKNEECLEMINQLSSKLHAWYSNCINVHGIVCLFYVKDKSNIYCVHVYTESGNVIACYLDLLNWNIRGQCLTTYCSYLCHSNSIAIFFTRSSALSLKLRYNVKM